LLYTAYHYFVHTNEAITDTDIVGLSEKILFTYENIFI